VNFEIPALAWLHDYDRAWLRGDLVAGITSAAVVVPQAMAYADIAGLPLVVGLYTALVPLVIYAVMGTSRPLSVTTTSTLAILTAGALHAIAPGANDAVLVSATATLAFLVGGILLSASLLRLGIVASFMSEPVLVGFKAGVGLVIVVDQLRLGGNGAGRLLPTCRAHALSLGHRPHEDRWRCRLPRGE